MSDVQQAYDNYPNEVQRLLAWGLAGFGLPLQQLDEAMDLIEELDGGYIGPDFSLKMPPAVRQQHRQLFHLTASFLAGLRELLHDDD